MDYRKELNDKQYEAVVTTEGPVLILAGAGSGKTRVLTYRIAYLVSECGVSPYNIMAITFTNKAAREMRERTENLLCGNIGGMWLNTFHSACGKILRSNAERIGFTKNFVIYDESEVTTVIKDCQRRLNIDDKRIPHGKIRGIISKLKDEMMTPEQFESSIDSKNHDSRMIAQVYKMYMETLKKNNAMDFDDMLLYTIKLFNECPDVLEYYQERFRYIMIDEYQDTNRAQYVFVSKLASKYHNLCVVGDDDQSIYSFRGADIRNILEFEKENKNCKVIKLEQNYRSTQYILDAANKVISNNSARKSKNLWTAKGSGDKIVHYTAYNQNEEAEFVVREIKKGILSGDMNYNDYAVLYRANALSKNIEGALVRHNIPYKIFGGFRFYDRAEIKDLIAYLRVFNNPADDTALRRIINVPKRGIGATSLSKAIEIAEREDTTLFNIMLSATEYPELSRAAQKMVETAIRFSEIMLKADEMSIPDFVQCVLDETGMISAYEQAEDQIEAQAKIENLKEFLSVAKEFENEQRNMGNDDITYAGFLEYVSLSTDTDTKAAAGDDNNKVTLMTVHSAKGLEFPVVFIVGTEDGIFPSSRSIEESADAVDEERRLCYVAITRAMQKLFILSTNERMLFGKTTRNMPSRFLKEIPKECMEEKGNVKSEGFGGFGNSGAGFGGGYSGYGGAQGRGRPGFGSDFESRQFEKANSMLEKQFKAEDAYNKKIAALAGIGNKKVSVSDNNNEYLKDFDIGQRVKHKKFGVGTVSKILGEGKNKTIEIILDEFGMKRLIIEYAKLQNP